VLPLFFCEITQFIAQKQNCKTKTTDISILSVYHHHHHHHQDHQQRSVHRTNAAVSHASKYAKSKQLTAETDYSNST